MSSPSTLLARCKSVSDTIFMCMFERTAKCSDLVFDVNELVRHACAVDLAIVSHRTGRTGKSSVE